MAAAPGRAGTPSDTRGSSGARRFRLRSVWRGDAIIRDFYEQLKKRRVIRTAIVYAALVWGALQVADLLAEAGFISKALVQGLIVAALLGFALTLLSSWFFEAPWRERKGLSVLGDVAVILAIAVGIFLLAWQQYFLSFTRPVLAIMSIEATDTRVDSEALGPYLAGRMRMVLASRPELAVIELTSSLRPEIANLGIGEKARALAADYVLSGTLNQGDDLLRVNLQLYDKQGELLWSEGFEDRFLDLGELESRMLDALWVELPLTPGGLEGARSLITACEYPPQVDAIRTLILADRGLLEPGAAVEELTELIERHNDSGLLHLARARAFFAQREEAPPPRKPVLNNLAMQDLDRLSARCPAYTQAELLKLHHNRTALAMSGEIESHLAAYPNDSTLMSTLAGAWHREGDEGNAAATAREAWRLDPLGAETLCAAVDLLRATDHDKRADEILSHAQKFISREALSCGPTAAMR